MRTDQDKNGIDYSNRLTEQDIILIGDLLKLAIMKFKDRGLYCPSALERAYKNYCELFNKEMSWSNEEL